MYRFSFSLPTDTVASPFPFSFMISNTGHVTYYISGVLSLYLPIIKIKLHKGMENFSGSKNWNVLNPMVPSNCDFQNFSP